MESKYCQSQTRLLDQTRADRVHFLFGRHWLPRAFSFPPLSAMLASVNTACQPTGNALLGVVHQKKAGIQIGRITRSAKK